MRYLLITVIALMSLSATAQTKKSVDKIKDLKWDGESYRVSLTNFQRPITISGTNANIPCLENASKSEMHVLVEIDSDIPMIKSCKLYTPGLTGQATMQAQEELPK